jgi:predicted ribosomally synthesized peptide with SipW-like signal peptide
MENKKVAAIMLIIAITLSAVGIVYAHWSDTATITGNIQMGTLTLAFGTVEEPACTEYYHNPVPGGLPEWLTGEAGGKDVGSANASFADLITDVHTGKEGFKTLNIDIHNAYPQWAVHTSFWAHNIGTVPLYLYGISLVGEKRNSTTGAVIYHLIMTTHIDPVTFGIDGEIYEDVDSSGNYTLGDILVINVVLKNAQFPLQIDPCHSDKCEIDIDFKQAAEQCHKYTLTFSLLAVQWNKLSEVWP